MSARVPRVFLFISALAAGSLRCEESELEKQCGRSCAKEYCGTDASEEFFDACIDLCVERQTEAGETSADCGEAHTALLACIDALLCEDAGTWREMREGPGTYPC